MEKVSLPAKVRSVEIETLLINETKLIDLVATKSRLYCYRKEGIEVLRRALEAKGCKVEVVIYKTAATPRLPIYAIELFRTKMKEIGSIIGRNWDQEYNVAPLDAVLIVSHPDGIDLLEFYYGESDLALYLPGLLLVRFCEKGTREAFELSLEQACLAGVMIREGYAHLVATRNSAEQINNLTTPFGTSSTRLNLIVLSHRQKECQDKQFTLELLYRFARKLPNLIPRFGFWSFSDLRFDRADLLKILPRPAIVQEQPDAELPHPDVSLGLSDAEVSRIFRGFREERINNEDQEISDSFIFKNREDDGEIPLACNRRCWKMRNSWNSNRRMQTVATRPKRTIK